MHTDPGFLQKLSQDVNSEKSSGAGHQHAAFAPALSVLHRPPKCPQLHVQAATQEQQCKLVLSKITEALLLQVEYECSFSPLTDGVVSGHLFQKIHTNSWGDCLCVGIIADSQLEVDQLSQAR